MTIASSKLPQVRMSVLRKRGPTRDTTGSCVATDVPRLPESVRRSHARYCTGTGRSSPSVCRRSCLAASDACGPSSEVAASPGASWMSRKITIDTPSITGTTPASRRVMKLPTACHRYSTDTIDRSYQSSGGLTKPLTFGESRIGCRSSSIGTYPVSSITILFTC